MVGIANRLGRISLVDRSVRAQRVASVPRQAFSPLGRRTLLFGLIVMGLGGCAGTPRAWPWSAQAHSASRPTATEPKTIKEFLAQEPVRLPHDSKDQATR